MDEKERKTAEELDAYLSARQRGEKVRGAGEEGAAAEQSAPGQEHRHQGLADLADELITLASNAAPDPGFSTRLESLLLQETEKNRAKGERQKLWGGLKTKFPGKFGIVAAAAALLVLISVFLWPAINPGKLETLPSLSAMAADDLSLQGGGLLEGMELVLQTVLPEEPEEMMVYVQDRSEEPTRDDVLEIAGQFGLSGEVYRWERPETSYSSGGAPSQNDYFRRSELFVVFDDARQVRVSRNSATYQDLGIPDEEGSLPFEQASQAAEEFLRSHDLLPQEYVIEPVEDMAKTVRFVPSPDGKRVINCTIDVIVSAGGQIPSVSYCKLELEKGKLYPIRSAEEIWDILSSGRTPGSQASMTVQRGSESYEDQPSDSKYWRPEYRSGELAEIVITPIVYANVQDPDDLVITTNLWGGILLKANPDELRTIASQDFVNVRGRIVSEQPLTLEVEAWEASENQEIQPFDGRVLFDGGQAYLETGDGGRYALYSVPVDLPDGQQVRVFGREIGTREAGVPVLVWYWMQWPSGEEAEQDEDEFDTQQPVIKELPASLPSGMAAVPPGMRPGDFVDGLEGRLEIQRVVEPGGRVISLAALDEASLEDGLDWQIYLTGDGLEGIEDYEHQWVRVWGEFNNRDAWNIRVERYEPVAPEHELQAWLGEVEAVQVEGKDSALSTTTSLSTTAVLFTTDEGEQYLLATSLREAGSVTETVKTLQGGKLLVEGVVRPEVVGGYPVIQEEVNRWGWEVNAMESLEGYELTHQPLIMEIPEETAEGGQTAGIAYVKSMELVYYSGFESGSSARDPGKRYIQPLWRLAGTLEDGGSFEILLQAVEGYYLR